MVVVVVVVAPSWVGIVDVQVLVVGVEMSNMLLLFEWPPKNVSPKTYSDESAKTAVIHVS